MTLRTCVTAALALGLMSAAPLAQSANPISDGIRSQWNGAKRNLQQSSEMMPEGSYDYRPVDGVRNFGEILAHVAGANYVFCAAAKGEKAPFAEDHFEKTAKTRGDIIKATSEAIAYCDAAFTALTDASAAQLVQQPFGQGQTPRVAVLVGEIGHVNEHYGNLVTYFRINGIVPPSSRR
jgi:uncharacterized damage-inducible protein DinB